MTREQDKGRCVLKTAHFGLCLYVETETLPWWYCGKAQERVDPSTDTERRIALQDAKRLISKLNADSQNKMLDRTWNRLYDQCISLLPVDNAQE